jgi:hypothetical protein
MKYPVIFGSIGHTVQVDETLLIRRKGLHGRILPQQWVFGGYDPVVRKGFLVSVPDRTRETIIPIIKRHVIEGTTNVSDEG